MGTLLTRPRWSPFLVGACIGALSWITFGLMGKALGTSTTFVTVVASLQSLITPEHVKATPYLAKHTKIDWQFMLVIGIFIGAMLSTLLARSYKVEQVPHLWAWRFGPARAKRYIAAFLGGILVLFVARLADGCTSGHGISGGLQFAVSSWVFFTSFFLAAVATAFILFGKEGRKHVNV
jgi:uncharacterized membrane protein YedE/YeeE